MVTEERVVRAAVEAAESVVFSRYDRSDLDDIDVAVSFADGVLEVDVYLSVPGADDEATVADEAALAARDTVDELLE